MFKSLRNQKGFTIIELLIVIAIIAILAGLVLNNFQGAQARARDVHRITDINTIHSQLEVYFNENGAYPQTFTAATFPGMDPESLVDPRGQSIVINAAVANEGAAGANPTAANNYLYTAWPTGCTNDCTGYLLKTYIERESETTPNPTERRGLNNQ